MTGDLMSLARAGDGGAFEARIATNRCLNARRSASRRAAKEWDVLTPLPLKSPPVGIFTEKSQ
ncbi:hypothetical protein AB0N05_32240 [Nocardia sp. NPDC051030]|uniref:hypothetical protein n=1 Tax=Nocardia sp. NPDC051030 TaxID=3155162 RepID=UPI003412CD3F